jgi:2'-hydroxyisoflavone reductase
MTADTSSRRDFIIRTSTALGALGLGIGPDAGAQASPQQRPTADQPPRRIRLLILGGTGFIGPFQVRYALSRGHDVTIFNRGRTAPGVFSGVKEAIGDRAVNNYESLKGQQWDAVIDNSASSGPTAPQWVREAAAVLKDSVGQYLFISTRSVYRDLSMVPATINAPLLTPENTPNYTPGNPYPYGLGKALAEGEALKAFGSRTTIVRPGLIVGPEDDTDRFTYWPARIVRGGEILAPGSGEDRVQVIDVRDLCEWVVRLCEARTFGTYMGVGPLNGRSMAEVLYGIASVVKTPLSWTWVPTEFLTQQRIRAYSDMPVWRPASPGYEGFARFDLTREVAAGLTFRTLADTAQATLDFHFSRPPERQQRLSSGITAEREAEVLRAWHARARG